MQIAFWLVFPDERPGGGFRETIGRLYADLLGATDDEFTSTRPAWAANPGSRTPSALQAGPHLAYRASSKEVHPDAGGDHAEFVWRTANGGETGTTILAQPRADSDATPDSCTADSPLRHPYLGQSRVRPEEDPLAIQQKLRITTRRQPRPPPCGFIGTLLRQTARRSRPCFAEEELGRSAKVDEPASDVDRDGVGPDHHEEELPERRNWSTSTKA